MDWNKAIEECPSKKNGICQVLHGHKTCIKNVDSGKCPIVKLHNVGLRKEKQAETADYQ